MWQADSSGCGFFRCSLPGEALARRGHTVVVDGTMPDWVQAGDVDVIVAQRTCLPGPSATWQRLARERKARLVFEIDDDLWHIDRSNKHAFQFYDDEHRAQVSAFLDAGHQKRLTENIRVADLVTVTTEPLAELVSQWNPNVHILPNCIPSWMLDQPMPDEHPNRLTLGWGGSPSHTRDFGEIAKPLKRVLSRFGDEIEWHCMGPDYTPRVATRRGRTRHTGWFDGVEDYLRGIDWHVSVAPLRPSTFNDSKSDLKVLESAALGIPCVASKTTPYLETPAALVSAGNPKEWDDVLIELIQNPSERIALAEKAREWASTRTIERHVHRWEEAYQGK